MTTVIDVVYAAGFFDGEGSIGFVLQNARRPILEWLQSQFGGKVYKHEFAKKPANWRAGFQWHINEVGDLERFLVAIRPYLRVKAALVDNGLELIALKRRKPPGRRGTPPDIAARMVELFAIHKALITRGKPGDPILPLIAPDPQMEMLA